MHVPACCIPAHAAEHSQLPCHLPVQAPVITALEAGSSAQVVQANEQARAADVSVGLAQQSQQAARTASEADVTAGSASQPRLSTAGATTTSGSVAVATGTVDDLFLCADKLGNSTMVEQLPQLKIEQVLDSNKPRSPQDVTLVTQLSFERLYMLEGQCDVWNGVISAAVYIALLNGKVVTVELNSNQDPRLTDIAEVEQKFKQFHQLAEAKGALGGSSISTVTVPAGGFSVPACNPVVLSPTVCRPMQAGPAAGVADSGKHLVVSTLPGECNAQSCIGQRAHRCCAAAGCGFLAVCGAERAHAAPGKVRVTHAHAGWRCCCGAACL